MLILVGSLFSNLSFHETSDNYVFTISLKLISFVFQLFSCFFPKVMSRFPRPTSF